MVTSRQRRRHAGAAGATRLLKVPRSSVYVLAWLALTPWAREALAQKWTVDAGVSSGLTLTNNAELAKDGSADAIVDVRPHVDIRAEGGRIKASGSAALNGVSYARNTQPGRLAPSADVSASIETIERLLFIDTGLKAFQTSVDPFGPRPESGSTTENSLTTVQWRLSPRIEGELPDKTRYSLRSENSWSRDHGATATDLAPSTAGYLGRHSVNIGRDPTPFGWRLEAQRSRTHYRDASVPDATISKARIAVDYLINSELTAGLNVGRENSSDPTTGGLSTTSGVQASWRPSPRTSLSVDEEKRSFGHSWHVGFEHRSRALSLSATLSRGLQTSAESILDLPASNDVATLLDGLFLSRFPDPIARASAVRDFITRQALPSSLLQPLTIRSQGFTIVTTKRLGLSYVGVRSSVSLSAFETQTDSPGAQLLAGTGASSVKQHGLGVVASHRLTPSMGLSASTDWTRVRGTDAAVTTGSSIQKTARVQLNLDVSPKTNAFAGARLRDLAADSNGGEGGREAAVFLGMDHRF